MQNSEAPAALVSSAARSTSAASRKGVAFTGVSNRDDWEQKWQSSGHPPVLADRMPSTSTLGPAPGQPDLVGQGGQRGDPLVGELGQGGQLSAGQEAALVEEGDVRPRPGRPGRSVRRSPAAPARPRRTPRLGAERETVVRMGVEIGVAGHAVR